MDQVAETIKTFVEGAIGVNLKEMVIQISSTLLLFLVVRYFFWNNITDYLEERKKHMADEYEEADKANLEAQALKDKAVNELTEIRVSAKGIIDEAKERGETERSTIVGNAKKEATIVIKNAHKEIESEIEKARTKINDEIVSVAVLMAEKVIKKEIDESKYKELLNEVNKEVIS